MKVGGSRMQSQQAQVDAVKTDILQTNEAIAKANVGMKTAERWDLLLHLHELILSSWLAGPEGRGVDCLFPNI